jgi:hypothetical protein
MPPREAHPRNLTELEAASPPRRPAGSFSFDCGGRMVSAVSTCRGQKKRGQCEACYLQCADGGCHTSITVQTMFQGKRVPLQLWFRAT